MKLDKLQIRLIIGFSIILVLSIIIHFIEPKGEKNKTVNTDIDLIRANATNFLSYNDGDNSLSSPNSNYNMKDLSSPSDTDNYKDKIFSLIDTGLKSNSQIEAFIYSADLSYFESNYKQLLDYIDIYKYKKDNYKFVILKDTKSYIWGSFVENHDNQDNIAYVLIDKTSGIIKSFNTNSIQVVIY